MEDRWKYPFYVIAILLLVLWLFGCDDQRAARPAVGPVPPTQAQTAVVAAGPASSSSEIADWIIVAPE